MKRSVLHITAFALRGGCEKNCYHFCAGTPDFSHEIIVLDKPGPMTAEWESLGVKVSHEDIIRKNLIAFGRELKKLVAGKKYDLVILWSTIRMPFQLNALNHVTPEIRVYLGNPLMPEYRAEKDRALQFMFPVTANVKLMACSSYVAKSHERDSYFGSFPMAVSLNPVALPTSFPAKTTNPSVFNLGMVARLDPIKDHATVLKGFKTIQQQVPDAKLHLVGDGMLRASLEEMCIKENIASAVTFHGDVADVYKYLNDWDVFVYATTVREGLGSVVEEAMANGLACVLSDLPMLKELAPEDGLVSWFDAGDAVGLSAEVIKLHGDPALREKRGHEVYNYAQQHFGVKRFIQDYLN